MHQVKFENFPSYYVLALKNDFLKSTQKFSPLICTMYFHTLFRCWNSLQPFTNTLRKLERKRESKKELEKRLKFLYSSAYVLLKKWAFFYVPVSRPWFHFCWFFSFFFWVVDVFFCTLATIRFPLPSSCDKWTKYKQHVHYSQKMFTDGQNQCQDKWNEMQKS